MALQGYGISVVLPGGWEGRIFTHAGDEDSDNRPTLHMASFPLPVDEGDFGFDVVAGMSASGIFVSLVEYTPDCYLPEVDLTTDPSAIDLDPSATVFSSIGIPVVNGGDFDQAVVVADTTLTAITAVQYPFSAAGRPFVLYVVVGDEANLGPAVGQVNALLDTLVISPALAVKFDAMTIDFQGDPFPSLINIGSLRGQGPCSGAGAA